LGDLNAYTNNFIFSNGEIRHNNIITYHASIQVSSDKMSTFENSLITESKTKPKRQTESKNTPNKNQGQLFIQRDLFEHKGQDKKYIDTMLKNKYLEILDLFFPITYEAFDKLNVKNGNNYLSIQTQPFNKMDFFVNGQANTIYNENLSYQDLKKNEIDNAITWLEKAKIFAINAKSNPENISVL
jgi:hypothetical protein